MKTLLYLLTTVSLTLLACLVILKLLSVVIYGTVNGLYRLFEPKYGYGKPNLTREQAAAETEYIRYRHQLNNQEDIVRELRK